MKFLKKCRKFKRPPQSIRISGANVVLEADKLKYFSEFETTLLNHQITAKKGKIVLLKEQSIGVPPTKLPAVDRKKLHKHFQKKLKFYGLQDNTKWTSWPVKEVPVMDKEQKRSKKDRNFKKRQKRRSRKTKHAADKAIESGSVVVLVQEEIPLGAIAVLGKGLGFVPTPKPNPLEERLQMRQTVNRVLTASN